MDTLTKLTILADAAKYDASCASSGTTRRNSVSGGLGSTESSGICHSYAPDGRCISLLKILLTNFCMFDCAYCVNRVSSNVRRARFTVAEVVNLTLDFYRRNYIEGLFLSSGIIRSPDATMEMMAEVARSLREDHGFRGYIHLKTIPEADPDLIALAGRYADRLSINIELPSGESLAQLAPEKSLPTIRRSMGFLRRNIEGAREERRAIRSAPRFSPAGQSTQLIVGADAAKDAAILETGAQLYTHYQMKRVYYSAFSPIPDASARLPLSAAPLVREHRLYQADWLLRFYDFGLTEIPGAMKDGMFDEAIDPKLAWALANRACFPVDINRAPKEMLLRIPGIGMRAVKRILAARRFGALRLDDVKKLTSSIKKVMPFISTPDFSPGALTDDANLPAKLKPKQLDLFA